MSNWHYKEARSAPADISDSEQEDDDDDIDGIFPDAQSSPSRDSESCDWLHEFAEEGGEEDSGPPVTGQLAAMVEKRFKQLHPAQRIKEFCKACPLPVNCGAVCIPKVNAEVGHRLDQRANRPLKFRDTCLSSIQRSIVGGAGVIIQMLEAFTQASNAGAATLDPKALFKMGLNVLSTLGHANYEASLRCRESLKGVVKSELAPALCGQDIPVTKLLFGDDFTQSVKNARQLAHVGRDVGRKEHTWSENGWKSHQGWKSRKTWQPKGPYTKNKEKPLRPLA